MNDVIIFFNKIACACRIFSQIREKHIRLMKTLKDLWLESNRFSCLTAAISTLQKIMRFALLYNKKKMDLWEGVCKQIKNKINTQLQVEKLSLELTQLKNVIIISKAFFRTCVGLCRTESP